MVRPPARRSRNKVVLSATRGRGNDAVEVALPLGEGAEVQSVGRSATTDGGDAVPLPLEALPPPPLSTMSVDGSRKLVHIVCCRLE